MDSTNHNKIIRLDVSRHLQDFNGYCGPACAMMVVEFTGSAKSPPVYAQNEFFKEIRAHAKANKDRRPVKSPAESLLTMLNDHAAGEMTWVKTFNSDTEPVAAEIVQAVEAKQQPCLMLVSKGMHWVVAFGVQRKDDGSPAGLLMRDPAWAGMPRFYGLSIFPEKPTIEHTASPCQCLNHTENPPGTVHERYITMHELVSGRGLQGSPDWEGLGAIALVPDGVSSAAALILTSAPAAVAITNPKEQAGEAALAAVRENGLFGRSDSPPDWNAALNGATAGEPILVKDPDDSEDDFYLVPLTPSDPAAKHGAWAMLDAKTLALREVSLLENWKTPAFPDENSGDAEKASEQEHKLPDGSVALFKKADFTPNTKNLVWAPSNASALPYWPVKELFAPHPATGEPVSIYVNQEGEVSTQLVPDGQTGPSRSNTPKQGSSPAKPKSSIIKMLIAGTGIAGLAAAIFLIPKLTEKSPNTSKPAVVADEPEPAVAGEATVDAGPPRPAVVKYLPSYYEKQFLGKDTDTDRKGSMPNAEERVQHQLRMGSHRFSDSKYVYLVIHKVLPQCRIQGTLNGINMGSVTWHRTTNVKNLFSNEKNSLQNTSSDSYSGIVSLYNFSHAVPVVQGRKVGSKELTNELSLQARVGGVYILRAPARSFQKP